MILSSAAEAGRQATVDTIAGGMLLLGAFAIKDWIVEGLRAAHDQAAEDRAIRDSEREEAERERETTSQLARFSRAFDELNAEERERLVG